jgi:hypothetical protein
MLPDRIADRIDAVGPCWLWQGSTNPTGYGWVWADGKNHRVHRYVYEQLVEPIPEGMTLDHLCRVRHCTNPDHLEVVGRGANVLRSPITITSIHARQTECVNGHTFDGVSSTNGQRTCRACARENQARYRERKRHADLRV